MSHNHEHEHSHEHNHAHGHEHNHEHSHEHGHEHSHEHGGEGRKSLICIIVSAVIFAGLFISEKLGAFTAIKGTFWVLVLYIVPYVIVGHDTIIEAVENLFHGELFDEDFLMLLASIVAFVIGEYHEAVAVMLLFQIGELFEGYAVGKSRSSIKSLMDIAPEFANVVNSDGVTEKVVPQNVEPGSIIVVKPGERIPLDSIVIEGESFVNTAALTGESVPRHIGEGETVYSGFVNEKGLLRCRTIKAYEDSMVARILELTENAVSRKSKTENFITRFSKIYTPSVIAGALALAVIPGIITGNWSEWILRACTFLVISCPCALVISVPLGFFGGIGAASGIGVLVKGSNYLEAAAKLGIVAFDKTGTITHGEFAVHEINPVNCGEDELLGLAAAVEAGSSHPVAKSVCAAFDERKNHTESDFEAYVCSGQKEISGCGISAVINGSAVLVGNAKLMEAENIEFEKEDAYGTIIYVAKDGVPMGSIVIADGLKENVRESLGNLRQAGVSRLVMLTGDLQKTADAVAGKAGVDEAYAELLPQDKVAKVEELLSELEGTDKKLGFVGDGINDAPVLARADLGIAMGSLGSDSAIEAADVVIMDDDLGRISGLIRIAKKTLRVVKENIVLALGVKLLVLVLGAAGIASMWLAVVADVGVAMVCILNSMRMLKIKVD